MAVRSLKHCGRNNYIEPIFVAPEILAFLDGANLVNVYKLENDTYVETSFPLLDAYLYLINMVIPKTL